MKQIKNILLTTDFSKYSLSAADYAIDLAEKYNAKIFVINVIEKKPPILAMRTLDLSEEKINEIITSEAKEEMNSVFNELKNKTKITIEPVIKEGLDYEEIVDYAEKNPIDLIVIATHGKTGILRTLIGSVAEKVIRYSKKPVLVITPGE
ncbi:MAG: universal stress protein [Ignavibacterium sp.]